jgi:hypothetical protein
MRKTFSSLRDAAIFFMTELAIANEDINREVNKKPDRST